MKLFSITTIVFAFILVTVIQARPTTILKRESTAPPGLSIRKGLPFKNEENGLALPDPNASNNFEKIEP
jgi:hypothetical protein